MRSCSPRARASWLCPAGCSTALWRLGGVPEEHRTDSLSAAFNNLAEQQELTRRYDELCRHYGMRASRCNPGQSHENGSIESRHDSLKTALDQALRLRGSRCFDERAAYEALRRRRSCSASTPAWPSGWLPNARCSSRCHRGAPRNTRSYRRA